MRFRLVEKERAYTPTAYGGSHKNVKPEWPPTRKTLELFSELMTSDEQISFVKERILRHQTFSHLFGVRSIMIDSILHYGLDPKRNIFLDFISKIKVPFPDSKNKPKMQYVYDSFKNDKLNIRLPVLYNPSLYNRNIKDFMYTLNVFNMMSQPAKAKMYIKNTDVINMDELFVSGSNMATSEIKPGGVDGRDGDTIFNVIESWTKNNEYSPEEIAQHKVENEKEEAEKAKNGKSKNGNGTEININVGDSTNKIEWSYGYFKGELEKIFANKSKFKTTLSSKNDYLNRAFATFTLPNMESGVTENKLYKKSPNDVKDSDVAKFGDPHAIDTPIPLNIRTGTGEVPGIYAFHQFIPLDDASKTLYKQIANKNLGNLKRHLNNVKPNDDEGVDSHSQAIVDALGELQEITHR